MAEFLLSYAFFYVKYLLLSIFKIIFAAEYEYNYLADMDDSLEKLQIGEPDYSKIIACMTQSNGITIMEYVVAKRTFLRWDGGGASMVRTFSMEDYFTYIHPDDIPIAKKLGEIMDEGKLSYYSCEYRYKFPGATSYSWQYNDIYAYKTDADHHVLSYLGVCRRNNKWHHAIDEMIMLRKKAEEANHAKNKFIEDMSHQIRTPLNSIIGFATLLCSEEFNQAQKDNIRNIIATNSDTMLQMFDDIFNMSILEEGNMVLHMKKENLEDLVKKAIQNFKIYENHNLKVYAAEMEKLLIVTDRVRLTDILKCLLSNAVKFTKEGHISVGYSLKYDGVEIFVDDTGCGIHDEDKDRIFGRFEKADDFSVGTGLGLAICKQLSTLMGGHISVVSQWGKGSTFLVWLPLNGI